MPKLPFRVDPNSPTLPDDLADRLLALDDREFHRLAQLAWKTPKESYGDLAMMMEAA